MASGRIGKDGRVTGPEVGNMKTAAKFASRQICTSKEMTT